MSNTYISKYTGTQIDAAIERSGTNESRIVDLETSKADRSEIPDITGLATED